MENQTKDKKKGNKKNSNQIKEKLETVINEDIKSIEELRHFLKFLNEFIKDFEKLSETYLNKLNPLITRLSEEELTKKKMTNPDEVAVSNLMRKILNLLTKKLSKMLKMFSDYSISTIKDIEKSSRLESTLNSKKNELIDNYLKQNAEFISLNSAYCKEYSDYEDYLTYKHLGLIKEKEEKPNNNNNDNKSKVNETKGNEFEHLDFVNDNNNIKKTKEIQDKIVEYVEKSNDNIKNYLKYFFDEKNSYQIKIYSNLKIFLDSLMQGFFAEKTYFKEIKVYNDEISDKINLITGAKLEGFKPFLFKIKPYSLKFIPDKENNSTEINMSEARLKNDLDYEKLYDIIMEIKENELLISEEDLIKFDEIQKILYMYKIIDSIFDDNYGEKRTKKKDKEKEKEKRETTETEEQKLENLKNYFGIRNVFRIAFVKYLNNKRSLGNLCINKKASKMLGNILFNLNEFVIKERDFSLFKIISFLSLTYYYTENGKKIYICNYLNSFPEFSNKQFWIDYLKAIIDEELINSKELSKHISDYSYSEIKNMKSKKLNICIYSNIFSLTKVMVDFKLKKEFIVEWLNIIVDNILYIDDTQKKEIIRMINEE